MRWSDFALLALLACHGKQPNAELASQEEPVCTERSYENFGEPFVERWCASCHAEDLLEGQRYGAPLGLDLDSYSAFQDHQDVALAAVLGGTMPPGATLSAAEIASFEEWVACGSPGAADSTSQPVGVPEVQVTIGPEWALSVEEASHPRVAFGEGEEARLVFDGGLRPPSAWAAELSLEGPKGEPWQHIESVSGFSTPDLAWSGGGWEMTARVSGRVSLSLDDEDEPRLLPLGQAAPLPFVAAPRVVSTAEGTGVAWLEPRPASNPEGDAYWLSWRTPEGDVANPILVGRAGGDGSQVAVASSPEGWRMAWSNAEGVMVAQATGPSAIEPKRVDQGGLAEPRRPALAVDRSGAMAVGWREQDDEQNGRGVRLRIWDEAGQPVTDELTLGLEPTRANRIALACDDGVLVAAWDEGGGDGDVALQFFDMTSGEPLSEPMVPHVDRAGRQQRSTVALRAGADGWTAHIAFEDEGSIAGAVVHLRWGP